MGMKNEKIMQALSTYEALLTDRGANVARCDVEARLVAPFDARSHLLYMVHETRKLVEEDRREKAMRWLGFIQGGLWMMHLRTIEEMKNDNKPDEVEDGVPPQAG